MLCLELGNILSKSGVEGLARYEEGLHSTEGVEKAKAQSWRERQKEIWK
jgi:hypothetical protein